MASNPGVAVWNDGAKVTLSVPMMTEERRKLLAKEIKHIGEVGKVRPAAFVVSVIFFVGVKREDETTLV